MGPEKIAGTVYIIDRDPTYVYGFKKLTQLKKLCEEVIDFQDVKDAVNYITQQLEQGKKPHVILLDIQLIDHIDEHFLVPVGETNAHLWKNVTIFAIGTLITHLETQRVKKYSYITDCLMKPTTEQQLAAIFNKAA